MRFLIGFIAYSLSTLAVTGPALAAGGDEHRSAYAGQEDREIKALSPQDVDELLNGRGWGFAKAAELNGMPGPAHLLELADEIGLSSDQRRAVQALFVAMQSDAKALGRTYVALERNLDRAFAEGTVTPNSLAEQLTAIAEIRGQLRLVHLRAHLQTPGLLTPHQSSFTTGSGPPNSTHSPILQQPARPRQIIPCLWFLSPNRTTGPV